MHAMESINRKAWTSALAGYAKAAGIMDQGEARAFALVLAACPRPAILDLGVGGGRTAGLLAPRAGRYVGIDYLPDMVERARRNHPRLDFRQADARDLSVFASGSFDVVVFSCNGIDSVDPKGRAAVMREVGRVLRPGGVFVFSSFHREWSGFRDRRSLRRLIFTPDPIRLGARTLRFLEGRLVGALRVRRLAALERRDDEHAVLLHWAHDFGLFVYATTPDRCAAQLAAAGFEAPEVFAPNGRDIGAEADADDEYHHYLARRRLPS